jgi:thiol-disulfide isomerase/thioredoxin
MNWLKQGRSLLVVGLFSVLLFSCKEEPGWDVTIRGKVGFPQQDGAIQLQELKQEGPGPVEAITLSENYTYEKKLRLLEPGYYRISFYDKQVVTFMLDKSDLEINVDGNDPSGFFEVIGSPDHDLLKKVQEIVSSVQSSPEMSKLEQDFSVASANQDVARITELQGEYLRITNQGHDQVAALIKDQPSSLAVINLLQQGNLLDRDKYFDLYIATADKLKKEWPNYAVTKPFIEMVDKMKVTAIGQVSPEIEMPNPDGQVIKLSSLRGKYVLVDFWAKWCGPCRRENPNVVKAYQKYKDKGFEVFGVSLDRNREDWLQAIQEDGLTWTHVSDLKYFDSKAANDYNISAIPFSILLDPEGKIIAKNLRGASLDKKLEEVLGGI